MSKISNADKGMLVVLISLLLEKLDLDEVTFTKEEFLEASQKSFSTQNTKTSITLKKEKKDGVIS